MDPVILDAPAALSTVVASLTFVLNEVRRRRKTRGDADGVRDALFELWNLLEKWNSTARYVNHLARRWVEDGVEPRGFRGILGVQLGIYDGVHDVFSGDQRYATKASLSLEELLRLYAPDVVKLAPLLEHRHEQLREGIADEIERRLREERRESALAYVEQLESAADGLTEFEDELSRFIRSEFPLVPRPVPNHV